MKLTPAQRKQIVDLVRGGASTHSVASEFRVSQARVWQLCRASGVKSKAKPGSAWRGWSIKHG